MHNNKLTSILGAAAMCGLLMSTSASAAMKLGKADLKSAGALAFGDKGVLFVGDSVGAKVFALETGDVKKLAVPVAVEITGINQKVAALLGTAPDQILINDVIVNPASKNVWMSVSRGRGPEATPAIVSADATGKLTLLTLDNIRHDSVDLPNPPAVDNSNPRAAARRQETITDLHFIGHGKLIVAGLSNEEFSSTLRSIPYPFSEATPGAGIEIYHGNHGRFETNAPVRTFVPYEINKQQHILAAYTCTPLVKIPVSELTPGNKVKGTTIAELGNRNRPIDMIVYRKDGKEYILMANSSRGVMKLPTAGIEGYSAITEKVEDKKGVPYETIEALKGVQQLDKLDDNRAVMLVDDAGSLNIRTVALP